eukprot:NODE_930_length_3034_cov_1.043271.p4 type:complete len:118 gc:universal NODE_930_length_3034_cov_1.043271:1396-1749(+)
MSNATTKKLKAAARNLGKKTINMKRIYLLLEFSMSCRNERLIKFYNSQIKEISEKSLMRLDPSIKQVICKKCKNWLDSKVEERKLISYCKCGYIKIYPLNNKTRFTDGLLVDPIDEI